MHGYSVHGDCRNSTLNVLARAKSPNAAQCNSQIRFTEVAISRRSHHHHIVSISSKVGVECTFAKSFLAVDSHECNRL